MDKDRIKGAAHQVKGAVKENAGKATGDTKLEGEGKAEKVAGKVQNTVGGQSDESLNKRSACLRKNSGRSITPILS